MYFQALSISILIHFLSLMAINAITADPVPEKKDTNLVEIEFIDVNGPQIVTEAQAPNLDFLNNRPTPYQSKSRQRVEEQQIAKATGKTENRSRFKSISPELLPDLGADNQGSASIKDLAEKGRGSSKKTAQIFDQVKQEDIYENLFDKLGTSTLENRIFEDIKEGHFTALNTDANRFYSFHQRVSDQVRIRWVENIQKNIEELKLQNPNKRFQSREWISQIEIILSKEGEIISSYVSKQSGADHWDNAALLAFRSAAPFLNPPEEMQDRNGQVRLSYLFSLTP